MHFFLLLCFFVFFKNFFFSSFFRYHYINVVQNTSVRPPHTHNTYLCVLVLRLRFRAQKAAFGRDDDEREEEEGADLAFFLF